MAAATIVADSPGNLSSLGDTFLERLDSNYSANSKTYETPEAYLEALSGRQQELSKIVQDIPNSRPASPVQDEVYNNRVEALRTRVQKAFDYANRDPSDGKWSALVRMLHLRSTMGGVRWLGTTTEGKMTESSIGWLNAQTEGEWTEFERRWLETQQLRKKVERWQEEVQAPGPPFEAQPPASMSSQDGDERRDKARPLPVVSKPGGLKNGKLGFPVVKKSSFVTAGKPRPTPRISPPQPPQDLRPKEPSNQPSDPAPETSRRAIDDISEGSFLPPSFPSQIATSTPNRDQEKRRKPEPIPAVPNPLEAILIKELPPPPPASTPSQEASFLTPSKPVQTRSPPSSPQKRARSITPGHPGKRSRSHGPIEEVTPLAFHQQSETPKQHALPTLTELLASAKKSSKGKGKAKATVTVPSSSPTPALPAEADIFSKPLEAEPSGRAASPLFPPLEPLDGLPQSTQQFASGSAMPPLPPFDRGGSVSPTKSLSSLAASDSDDDDDDERDVVQGGMTLEHETSAEFNPPFFSTQPEHVALAKAGVNDRSGVFIGFNSQFSVNERVDEVGKFMDDDIDYDKWMKYPEHEDEDS